MRSTIQKAVSGFFAAIAGFFADFGTAIVKGDLFVKLSLLWIGAGYARRKQYVKAALMTVLGIAIILFTVHFSFQYVGKFGTLGTVQMEQVFNPQTMKTEWNDYDNSFLILLSLLLNNKFKKGKKFWRLMFIITIAVPQFVSLLLVRNFFSNGGIVNTICANIGLTDFLRNAGLIATSYIPFLSAPGWAHVMIILINIWIGVPYQMLIATGVLMNLPTDQLESARVDGATRFQTFRYITMPYLLFVTAPTLVTDFVRNINNFNVIYLLTQDVYTTTNQAMANSQAKVVDLLITWLFTLTQDYHNYKMAAVIGIIVFLVCAVFTLIAFNFVIGGDKEGVYQ